MPGYNHAVVADSAVPERYHVFTSTSPRNKEGRGYHVVEQGETVTDVRRKLPDSVAKGAQTLVALYERIRRLDRFDSNHCPIIEMQRSGDTTYFLQYHRTINAQPATFSLNRDRQPEEIAGTFVRGATPAEGKHVTATVYNSYYMYDMLESPDQQVTTTDEAAFDIHHDQLRMEVTARGRGIQFLDTEGAEDIGASVAGFHLLRSQLFKPSLTIGIGMQDWDPLLTDSQGRTMDKIPYKKGNSLPLLDLWVVSDGRRAYIKKLA